MVSENEKKAIRGQALYTKQFLAMYDQLVLGFNCPYVWRCPSRHMLKLYNKHVSANHLEIGVGTGYFLDHCKFPIANPRLVLIDLNPNSLEKCKICLERYNPESYRMNALELDKAKLRKFDSVALTNLLHCLPGTMKTKGVVFENINKLLNPGGVVFGSTLLYKGVKKSFLAWYFMNLFNILGVLTNKQDDLEGLKQNLEQHFSESSVKVIGSIALFWARKSK